MDATQDVTRFVYVDTAANGEGSRNNPMPLDAFRPRPGARGVYVTYLRYDDGLVTWWRTHWNTKKNHTVGGYRGPALASILPFDVDRASLAEALVDVRRIVECLAYHWAIPPDAIRVCFSGGKGFHVEVPSRLFGGFLPAVEIPARLFHLARTLLADLELAIDEGVYQHLRLWRVENTLHQRENRYAIPLTVDELLTLDMTTIARLAAQPRQVPRLPDDEWIARPKLVDVWRATEGMTDESAAGQGNPAGWIAPALAAMRDGNRNTTLFRIGGWLRRFGATEADIRALLQPHAERVGLDADELDVVVTSATRYRPSAPGETAANGEYLLPSGDAIQTITVQEVGACLRRFSR